MVLEFLIRRAPTSRSCTCVLRVLFVNRLIRNNIPVYFCQCLVLIICEIANIQAMVLLITPIAHFISVILLYKQM